MTKIKKPNKYLFFSFLLAVPLLVFCRVLIKFKSNKFGGIYQFDKRFVLLGFIIGFALAIIHEILHAIPYPKKTKVEIQLEPKSFSISTICNEPVSRNKYILSSILPIILGVIPLTIYMFTPINMQALNTILAATSCINFIMPCSDYLDIVLILKQAPKNAMVIEQEDGVYWYKKIV